LSIPVNQDRAVNCGTPDPTLIWQSNPAEWGQTA